jgi:hypothetical protein
MKIEINFKKIAEKLNKKMFLILMLTIVAHAVLLAFNSDAVARQRAAFSYSIKYHKSLVSSLKGGAILTDSDGDTY